MAHIHGKEFVPLAEALLTSSDPATIFDDYRNRKVASRSRFESDRLREILIIAVSECLNHDDYVISTNAAMLLRQNAALCARACELDTVVSDLTEQLNGELVQPAREAALSLAFLLSTRPRDQELPQWRGSDPMTSSMADRDIDQNQFTIAPVDSGYLHEITPDIAEDAIEFLIQNLDRKEYKRSSNWVVAKNCAKAIGAIGYQRPALVADAVPVIGELLGEYDERQAWLIYALTSIGYSRPDLLPAEFADQLEEFAEEAGFGVNWRLKAAISIGYRKIGHAPAYLEIEGCNSEIDLSKVVEKLYRFMLGRYPSAHDEVIQAFVEIYSARPAALVDLLQDELDQILNGSSRSFDFPSNFMFLLKELASIDVANLQPLLESSKDFYQDHSESHYWYENSFEFHRRVATQDQDLLPDQLGETVTEFLQSEKRASVRSGGQRFLQNFKR
ncbi:hypothetical protein [Halalkalicoccus subterraneus]|uniref:hypothetical protein n=1 Tax=Halalkalicoccus subterraneus TaxID=2675002 RepID=UPI0013CF248E|nr:hypothetical protein [Halalkalicoccus subterraneus]